MALPCKHPNKDAFFLQKEPADGGSLREIEIGRFGGQEIILPAPAAQRRISPEMELILACAHPEGGGKASERVRASVTGDLDWDVVLQYAAKNGVLQLLFSSLSKIGFAGVPEAIVGQSQKISFLHTCRNLLMVSELTRVLRLLEEKGIAAVPFKGPSLAASIYGNIQLRSSYDLDIVVREKDVLKAKDLIISSGYEIQGDFAESGKAAESIARKKDFKLVHPTTKVTIELHWRLTGKAFPFRLGMDGLWQRLHKVSVDRMQVQSFSAEDLLLILCVHGSKHLWTHLLWIADIAHMLKANPELDWDTIVERAKNVGAERMLFLGLLLARGVFAARVPDKIREKAEAEPEVRGIMEYVCNKIFAADSSRPSHLDTFRLHMKMRERWRDKIHMSLRYLQAYTRSVIKSGSK